MGWPRRMLTASSTLFLLLNQKAQAWGFQSVERLSRPTGEHFGLHKTRTRERQYSLPFQRAASVNRTCAELTDRTSRVEPGGILFSAKPREMVRGRPLTKR